MFRCFAVGGLPARNIPDPRAGEPSKGARNGSDPRGFELEAAVLLSGAIPPVGDRSTALDKGISRSESLSAAIRCGDPSGARARRALHSNTSIALPLERFSISGSKLPYR